MINTDGRRTIANAPTRIKPRTFGRLTVADVLAHAPDAKVRERARRTLEQEGRRAR